ncbi:MAG: hypothetical protein ACXWCM_06150 [Acidimicrobiales bacterium]
MTLSLEQRIDLHKRMAAGYREAYMAEAVKDGGNYDSWKFAPSAIYSSPYFTGDEVIDLGALVGDLEPGAILAAMEESARREAKAYSVTFPDWKPEGYDVWPAENGFVQRVRWQGTTKEGERYGFYSITFVKTNDEGEIVHWQTFVNDDEYGPFLEKAIGRRGPFKGSDEYMELVDKVLADNGLS